MTQEERIIRLEREFIDTSKLVGEFTSISLEHSKSINRLIDICTMLKDRNEEIEKDMQDREADIKVLYSKVKDMEKANGK